MLLTKEGKKREKERERDETLKKLIINDDDDKFFLWIIKSRNNFCWKNCWKDCEIFYVFLNTFSNKILKMEWTISLLIAVKFIFNNSNNIVIIILFLFFFVNTFKALLVGTVWRLYLFVLYLFHTQKNITQKITKTILYHFCSYEARTEENLNLYHPSRRRKKKQTFHSWKWVYLTFCTTEAKIFI